LKFFENNPPKTHHNNIYYKNRRPRFPIPLSEVKSMVSENLISKAAVVCSGYIAWTERVAWAVPAKLSMKKRSCWIEGFNL